MPGEGSLGIQLVNLEAAEDPHQWGGTSLPQELRTARRTLGNLGADRSTVCSGVWLIQRSSPLRPIMCPSHASRPEGHLVPVSVGALMAGLTPSREARPAVPDTVTNAERWCVQKVQAAEKAPVSLRDLP